MQRGPQEPLLSASWQSANKDLVDEILNGGVQENGLPASKYAEIREVLREEQRAIPLGKFGVLCSLFAWLLLTDTLKDFVRCGSALYWMLVLSVVPIVAVLMTIVRAWLLRKGNLKREVRSAVGGTIRARALANGRDILKLACRAAPVG